MSSSLVRLCTLNLDRFGAPVEAWRGQGCEVEIVACLAQCGDCEACPFAEIEGDLFFADTLAHLNARVASCLTPEGVPQPPAS